MVNEGGEIEGGMLGEYVNLYDTNSDSENPSAVPESHTNTDPKPTGSTGETVGGQQPQRSQQKIRRGQVNAEPKVEAQNNTAKSSYARNGQENEYSQSSNNDQNTYVPGYNQRTQNQQVIPPLIDNQYQNSNYVQQPVGQQQTQYVQQPQQQQAQYVQAQPQQQVQYVQAQPQQQTQYIQQTQYVQQPQQQQTQYVQQPQQQTQYAQQPQQQIQYVQAQPQQQTQYDQQQVQYIQQPTQYQQANYAPQSNYVQTSYQQPVYVQSPQVAQPQMSNYVGTGLNQVPTIIYY